MMKFNYFSLAVSMTLAAGIYAMAGAAYAHRDDDHESSEAVTHEHEHARHQRGSHDRDSHDRDSRHGDDTDLAPGDAHPVTLSNQGAAPLEVDIRFRGKDPRDFTQTNNCGERLKGQDSCVIKVTFAPRAPGAKSAMMEIHTSGGTKYVYLTGTGI